MVSALIYHIFLISKRRVEHCSWLTSCNTSSIFTPDPHRIAWAAHVQLFLFISTSVLTDWSSCAACMSSMAHTFVNRGSSSASSRGSRSHLLFKYHAWFQNRPENDQWIVISTSYQPFTAVSIFAEHATDVKKFRWRAYFTGALSLSVFLSLSLWSRVKENHDIIIVALHKRQTPCRKTKGWP